MAGADVVNPEEGSLENRVSTMAGTAIEAWRARGVEGMVSGPGGHDLPATAHGSDIIAGGRERGAFTDEVAVASDASPLDKLAAFAGRRTPVSVVA